MDDLDLLIFIMENRKSGLSVLAEQQPAVKAYKQIAWHINQVKKTEDQLPGATILSHCMARLAQENNRNMMNKWKFAVLDLERPYCNDRFFTMISVPEKQADKKQEPLSFLFCNTHPNLNILLEVDFNSRRACWLYYDALKETALQHALVLLLQIFVEKEIRTLNICHVASRLNIGLVKTFFKRSNYIIQIEQPVTTIPAPKIQP